MQPALSKDGTPSEYWVTMPDGTVAMVLRNILLLTEGQIEAAMDRGTWGAERERLLDNMRQAIDDTMELALEQRGLSIRVQFDVVVDGQTQTAPDGTVTVPVQATPGGIVLTDA